MAIASLSEKRLQYGSRWLADRDAALGRVLKQYGYPPLWSREPGFSTLVHIILEQQVSLASANATFARLREKLSGVVTPQGLLDLKDEHMRELGVTRQKMLYTRLLAEEVCRGKLDFESLSEMPDDDVRKVLMQLKGIGQWTADIYLSECLLRPDIMPKGDIGVQEAFRVLKGMEARPVHAELEAMTEHWRPWRSVGTRMLWHFYLNERKSR